MITLADKAMLTVRGTAELLAKIWQPSLNELSERWGPGATDWSRVYPGLIALIGFKTLLWPRWMDLALQQLSAEQRVGASPNAGDWYCRTMDGELQNYWQAAFHGVSAQVAWVAVSAPGLSPYKTLIQSLTHQDVQQTLGSLDAQGKVIATGGASERLRPLTGRTLSGDSTLGLPICDCEVIIRSLSDWQTSVVPLIPLMAQAVSALRREWNEEITGGRWLEYAQLSFGTMAWHLWQQLLDTGSMQTGRPVKQLLLARLFSPFTPAPFTGVMILHGDHYLLWQRVKEEIFGAAGKGIAR